MRTIDKRIHHDSCILKYTRTQMDCQPIPRADRIIQFVDGGTLFFGIPWKEGLCGKPPNQPLSGYEIKVGRKATLICRRQGGRGEKNSSSKYHLNTIEKGMLRLGKKLCKQGVPYKEPQKNPVLRNAKPSDGLLGRGSSPMEQAATSHTTGRGAVGLRRQIPQFTHPRHEYPPFVSVHSWGEFQPFSSF